MDLFQNIIELVIKKQHCNDYYNLNTINKSKMFALYPMYFFTADNEAHMTKFTALKENILENKYLADEQKEMYLEIFYESQTIYHSLIKFSNLVKYKITKKFDMDCDIRFNNLSNFPEKQKISLIHYNTKYIFRLSDLCKLWKDALMQTRGIKPNPTFPKNPFIRKVFLRNHLLAIYLKLKETDFKIPLCIQAFFNFNFDIDTFKYKCYPLLKDKAIDYYFYHESSAIQKLYDIVSMLRERKTQIGDTYISDHFDIETKIEIVNKLKKYLIMHLYATESCNPIKRMMYNDKCEQGLINFFKENSEFCNTRLIWPRRTRTRNSLPYGLPAPINLPPLTSDSDDNLEQSTDSLTESTDSVTFQLPQNLRDSIDEILNSPIENPLNYDILQEAETLINSAIHNDDIDIEDVENNDEEELIPTVTVDLNNLTNDN